jgi:hypothetical protein
MKRQATYNRIFFGLSVKQYVREGKINKFGTYISLAIGQVLPVSIEVFLAAIPGTDPVLADVLPVGILVVVDDDKMNILT